MSDTRSEDAPWPLRALLLLAGGATSGLFVHLLVRGSRDWQWTESPVRLALAALVAIGFVATAFSLERLRWRWSLAFGLCVGLVVGFVTWTNGPSGGWGSNEGWQLFSALLAVAIAVPLFQTMRDAGRLRIAYQPLHGHSWTNIVLWCAVWGFVLVTWLLANLLAELFGLIGIRLLRDLLREGWFAMMLVGGAFGLATGLFRDRDRVLELLQKVVTAIIAVLTPVLALGLLLFVLSLPFTGLEPLWSQTKQTTPILLTCILGAFLLVNATIGAEEDPRPAWLRHSAMGLAAVMLPLAIVAAISVGKRIDQYGFTPDRLWASVFVLVALSTGALYLAAILRRRLAWATDVRRANVGLALGVCALALLLALPVLSFGAISARDQVARLQSGKVTPDKFDWAALRFDFGPAGVRTLQRLARESTRPEVRRLAAAVGDQPNRYQAREAQEAAVAAARPRVVTVIPRPAAVPAGIADLLYRPKSKDQAAGLCVGEGSCILKWQPGEAMAVALHDECAPYAKPDERRFPTCGARLELLALVRGQWRMLERLSDAAGYVSVEDGKAQDAAIREGRLELREVPARQVYIDGQPVGPLFRAPQPVPK